MKALLLLALLAAFSACAESESVFDTAEDSTMAASSDLRFPKQNQGDLELFAVADLPKAPLVKRLFEKLLLIDAPIAEPTDWPASFFSQSAEGNCTSAQVGPRALLTAAHCVGDGELVSIPSRNVDGRCEHAPDYRAGNPTADLALCLIEIPGIPYERLSEQANVLNVGDELLLTGFGCIDHAGNTDRRYRVGTSRIESLPINNNHFIKLSGGATVCLGDSGGPAFLHSGSGPRRLVAVNAQGDLGLGVSFLASVSTQSARAFISDWAERNGAPICGVNPEAEGCRE